MNDRLPGTTYTNPIWYKEYRIYLCDRNAYAPSGYNYIYIHDDYDGAKDARDNRCGYTKTIEEAKAEIDGRD